ncbi:MAG TPA: hypothetical protein VJW76_04290, partial [Verrucomicrobiae bacterium]|nr:hypothetical protein [Verrucomicrobiae bacterium]
MKRPLKKRWRVATVAAIGLVAAFAVFRPFGKREPVYGGKSVTAWARDLNSPDPWVRSNATEAVRATGPDGVPFLVK